MAQHLVDGLRAVIARAEQLTEQQQEALATAWEAMLEEQEWMAIVSKPAVRSAIERLSLPNIKPTKHTGYFAWIPSTPASNSNASNPAMNASIPCAWAIAIVRWAPASLTT